MAELNLRRAVNIGIDAYKMGDKSNDGLVRDFAAIVQAARAEAWDERDRAKPQYLGPDHGHYEDCLGWEDCYCASYPNPYKEKPDDRED